MKDQNSSLSWPLVAWFVLVGLVVFGGTVTIVLIAEHFLAKVW